MSSIARMMFEAASAVHGEFDPWEHINQAPWEAAARVVIDPDSDPQGVLTKERARTASFCMVQLARPYYWNPRLTYHNWQHIEQVFSAYNLLWGPPHPEVECAIAFHDCVYVPGTKGQGLNERLSADAFIHEYRKAFGLESKVIDHDFVYEIILATEVANHCSPTYRPASRYIARVMDADLHGLGARTYKQFVALQESVIQEFAGPGWSQNAEACHHQSARFLQQFIADDREYVYHTSEARDSWEERAVSNIQQYCDDHDGWNP